MAESDDLNRGDMPGDGKESPDPESLAAGHEVGNVGVAGVLKFAIGLAVLAVVVHVAMWGLFKFFAERRGHAENAAQADRPARVMPPAPQLEGIQPSETETGSQDQSSDHAEMNSYGWMDEKAGIA